MTLQFIVIVIYLSVILAVGVFNKKRIRKADDFFVAGRQGSSFLITGSLLATIIGGSATVGLAGLGYTRGLTGAWWLLVGSIGLVVLGLFFAQKVRSFGLYTLPELAGKQYDNRIALAASILIVISWIGIIAAQIVAAGKILGVLEIGNPTWWMVIFTIIFVTYSCLGGQHAVIRTDVIQTIIIFVGIVSGLVLLLSYIGGLDSLKETLSPEQFYFPLNSKFSGVDLISLMLLVGLTYLVGPDMYSRLFCARDTRTAKVSVLWAALFIIPFAFAITLLGMGASALFPQIPAEQALPFVISEVMPPMMSGIILAALLCAVMSSADTVLLTTSTILTVDIIKYFKPSLSDKETLNISRYGIIILGVISLFLALRLQGVISSLLFAYTIYTCGLIIPVIAGFYKDKLKITSNGALAAIIGGGTTALIGKIFGINYLDLGGLLVSVSLLFLVSFINNRRKKGFLDYNKGIQ